MRGLGNVVRRAKSEIERGCLGSGSAGENITEFLGSVGSVDSKASSLSSNRGASGRDLDTG